MPRSDFTAVIEAIERLIELLTAFGDSQQSRVVPFRQFIRRIEQEGLAKGLLTEINGLKDEVFIQAREQIWAGRTLPGIDQHQTARELQQRAGAIFNASYPVESAPADLDISGFVGSDRVDHKGVLCRGDPAGARAIIEQSIALLGRYAEALERRDFAAAYAMTDTGLRGVMSFDEFVSVLRQAEREYQGPELEFRIERFAYVLTDEPARQKSTAKEGWPKGTAKQHRRCRVLGFWVRDRAAQSGCRGALWISEEKGEYRVARFEFSAD